jgi:hypothetical protein
MERESSLIPVADLAPAPHIPMHVRYVHLLRANVFSGAFGRPSW